MANKVGDVFCDKYATRWRISEITGKLAVMESVSIKASGERAKIRVKLSTLKKSYKRLG